MTEQPVTVLIHFHATPGNDVTISEGLRRALVASTDPALLGGQVLIDTTDTAHVVAIQSWSSSDAFWDHLSAAGGFTSLLPLLQSEPQISTLV